MQPHLTRTRQRQPFDCLIYDIGSQVQELCRDFCTRYIACLRGKMQSENLLRSDYPLEHNNNMSNSNSPVNNSPEQVGHTHSHKHTPPTGREDFINRCLMCCHKEPITPTQPAVYFGGNADYLSGGGSASVAGAGADVSDFSSIQGEQLLSFEAKQIQKNSWYQRSDFNLKEVSSCGRQLRLKRKRNLRAPTQGFF